MQTIFDQDWEAPARSSSILSSDYRTMSYKYVPNEPGLYSLKPLQSPRFFFLLVSQSNDMTGLAANVPSAQQAARQP